MKKIKTISKGIFIFFKNIRIPYKMVKGMSSFKSRNCLAENDYKIFFVLKYLKNLKIFLWKKDAFGCAGIREQVFRFCTPFEILHQF